MSNLLDITRRIQDTDSTIAKAKRAMLEQEPTPSILAAFESLEKRRTNLETQFEIAANANQLDVCDYRVFYDGDEDERPPLRVFTKTLGAFQKLFTQVYHSIKTNQPHKTTRVKADIIQETDFGLNYTFEGSLGVVLTLPNAALLYESDIDESVKVIAELAKLDDTHSIAQYAKKFGLATIRSLYEWTADQVSAGVGSEIHWKKGTQIKVESLAEFPDLVKLKEAIEATSDEVTRVLNVTGTLVGIDLPNRSFHMSFDAGEDIRGKFDDRLAQFHFKVPEVYRARIVETKTIFYSTEKEKATYLLESLE